MGVWITGDIHGNPIRLRTKSFYEQKEFSGNKDENTVIIAGDFGLVWDYQGETVEERHYLDWLEPNRLQQCLYVVIMRILIGYILIQ